MALKKTSQPADDQIITPLADNPKYAALSVELAQYRQLRRRLDVERQIEAIRRHFDGFAGDVKPGRLGPRDLIVWETKERLERELAALPPLPSKPREVETALHRLSSGPIPVPPTRQERVADLNRRVELLDLEIAGISARLEDLRIELSIELAKKLRLRHGVMLVEVFEAASRLQRLTDQERELRAEVMRAGFRCDLEQPRIPVACLGFESIEPTPMWQFAELLKREGLI